MKEKLSVKDIAKLAGVSVATVSRVLNQNGRFSAETEARILKIIEENNYQPNMLARGLRTSKVSVIGIIVPDITNDFFAQITLALQNTLFDYGYSTIICNTNEVESVENRHREMLQAQQVSGLVCISGAYNGKGTQLSVPTVFIDREPLAHLGEKQSVLIESNNEQGGRQATMELIKKGCKKLAILRFKETISSHRGRYEGFKACLEENNLEFNPALMRKVKTVSMASAQEAVEDLLATGEEIDGMFCTADILALGALKALQAHDIAVPETVKLAGFDDSSYSRFAFPEITTVRQSVETFGSLAAETLIAMIDGKPLKKHYYQLPTQLIVRGTT